MKLAPATSSIGRSSTKIAPPDFCPNKRKSIEREVMATFIYVDNSDYPNKKVVFECQAEKLTDADVLYEKATSKNPIKEKYIGCMVRN